MQPVKLVRRAPLAMLLTLLLAFSACQGEAPTPQVADLPVPAIDSERAWNLLLKQVALGPRPSGSEANRKTRDLLVSELTSYGLKPVREAFQASTPIGVLAMENIFADLEGPLSASGEPAPMIVLGSHFDTKLLPFEFVGANDGASSTGLLLELARVLANGPQPPLTYRFVFFDGEEATRTDWIDPDNRYGSKHHVKQIDKRKGALKRVKAMINLDLVGDKDLHLEYDSSSTRRLVELFRKTSIAIGDPDLFSRTPYPVEDDHEMFIQLGIPSIDLIDLHFGPRDNEYWHQAEDVVANCSKQSLERVGKLVLAALPEVIDTFAK
ncbi:MAG: glutaminyl-peptide cyclotransferase [Candidatus Paceibacteria bacterium]|jgi:glutaminyl-peptide cyclotransferase